MSSKVSAKDVYEPPTRVVNPITLAENNTSFLSVLIIYGI